MGIRCRRREVKSIFCVEMVNGQPVLPPFADASGVCLWYENRTRGGWSCIGAVPVPGVKTVLVQVDASAATIAAMKKDAAYLWLEDVKEQDVSPIPAPEPKEIRGEAEAALDPVAIKAWLAAKGHKIAAADEKWSGDAVIRETVQELHGITKEQYQWGLL